MNDKWDIKIVILKKPYDSYKKSEVMRDFLSNVFKLKLDGYTTHYPYGILPISDIDFVCDHILMCLEKEDGVLEPISGFTSIRYSVCKQFHMPFPIVNHKFGEEAFRFPDYVKAIHRWVSERKEQNQEFAYNASWTIKPGLEKELRNLIRDLTYSLVPLYYAHEKIDFMINSTAALHAVNINEERMGMHYLQDEQGHRLSPFPAPTFFDQPFYIMHTNTGGFDKEFIEFSLKKYDQIWNNRLIIGVEEAEIEKAAA